MRKLIVAFGLACLMMSATGCILTPARGRRTAVREPSCHPSQYWDGHKCRHKGKGHGARKHDGR
jgi:hypothetical protein